MYFNFYISNVLLFIFNKYYDLLKNLINYKKSIINKNIIRMNTYLWTFFGFYLGGILMEIINICIYKLNGKYMSKKYKCLLLIVMTLFGFLRGYTGNNLVTNIKNILL